MGLIQKLKNKTVFLDTAPLIYYIEENQQYSPILNKVHPMRENKHQLVEEYQNILCNSSTINIFELNIEIAKRAAGFRAKYGLKTPDSIQVATAVYTSAEYFLTNDIRLKAIKEIETLVLDEFVKG